jgi:hypothetical protein
MAQSNREGIEAIIRETLDWERRSGATFDTEKTNSPAGESVL